MLDLPPLGTRGADVPRALRLVISALIDLMGGIMFRRGGKVQGRPLLRLTTTGARTGSRRTTMLGWFPDQGRVDSWIVVASNGGSSHHPDWAYNLAANPGEVSVDTGDGEVPVEAKILTGPERKTTWTEIAAAAPGYGSYQEKTDREIPLFRLTPRPSPDTD